MPEYTIELPIEIDSLLGLKQWIRKENPSKIIIRKTCKIKRIEYLNPNYKPKNNNFDPNYRLWYQFDGIPLIYN